MVVFHSYPMALRCRCPTLGYKLAKSYSSRELLAVQKFEQYKVEHDNKLHILPLGEIELGLCLSNEHETARTLPRSVEITRYIVIYNEGLRVDRFLN